MGVYSHRKEARARAYTDAADDVEYGLDVLTDIDSREKGLSPAQVQSYRKALRDIVKTLRLEARRLRR